MSACSGGTVNPLGTVDRFMSQDGSQGSTEATADIDPGSALTVFFESEVIDADTWDAGDYIVDLTVTTEGNNLTVSHVWICQIGTSGDCSSTGTIGDASFSRDISVAGVQSFTVPGQEMANSSGNRVYVAIEITNGHNMATRTVGITPDQTVSTPIPEPTTETVTVATNSATDVTDTSATLNGEVTEMSGVDSVDAYFEWREVGASSWTTTTAQTLSATGTYNDSISGLNSGTDYEFRAVADGTNDSDTGTTSTFTTDASEAFFDVEIIETNSPVDEGDTLQVDYTVTNTGDASATQNILLNILSEWWATDTAWDNAQSESFVHHSQPTGTDWAAADTVELGPTTYDMGGSALEAYWALDEDSGSTANDVSGNGRDGTIDGAAVGQTGILGSTAYGFDGTDDKVEITHGTSYSEWTVAFWAYPTAVSDQHIAFSNDLDGWNDDVLIGINPESTNTAQRWAVNHQDDADQVRTIVEDTADAQANTWHHVTATASGSTLTLYIDGSEVDSTAVQGQDLAFGAHDLRIGAHRADFSTGRQFEGRIDEVRFYSRALTQGEVQTLAHGDSPTGSLTTPTRTATDSTTPTELRTTASLGGGTIDIVVHEDTDQDGTAENTQTVTLAGGTDEVNSLSGYSGGADVDYWIDIEQSVSSPTDTAPTLDKAEIVRE